MIVWRMQEIAARCHSIRRDPRLLRRSAQFAYRGGGPSELLETLGRWHAMGFTELIVMCGSTGLAMSSSDPVRDAEVLATRVLPEIRAS